MATPPPALHRDPAAECEEPSQHQASADLNAIISNDSERRSEHSDQLLDRGHNVSRLREALSLLPIYHPKRVFALRDLAEALCGDFQHPGGLQDLDEGALLLRQALASLPAYHPRRWSFLNRLGAILNSRFEQSGKLEDLHEAVSQLREALSLLPTTHPDWALLSTLARALHERFKQTGDPQDLDDAISLNREALYLRPGPHPDRIHSLHNLSSALHERSQRTGNLRDLDDAVSLLRQARASLPADHPRRASLLDSLGTVLSTRFEATGELHDLDEAVLLENEAFGLLPVPHPDRTPLLDSIASVLQKRFNEAGDIQDLQRAILLHREGLHLRPFPNPDRTSSLNNLANALEERFQQLGDIQDLDEAILLHREALSLRPAPHPDRLSSLNNLAPVLHQRFKQAGDLQDIEEAVSLLRQAIASLSTYDPRRSTLLNSLGVVLHTYFKKVGQLQLLDEAIALHHECLRLRPAHHPERASSLNNLATALGDRFRRAGNITGGFKETIPLQREALALLPASHSHRLSFLLNLTLTLRGRAEETGQFSDLEEAIKMGQESFEALPEGHPSTCDIFANMGQMLMPLYRPNQNSVPLDVAMVFFRTATQCEAASVPQRFQAAKQWAGHADTHHESALEAYQTAIGLLPRLAMLGLDLQSRQRALKSQTDGLARDAAACATRADDIEKAIEFLEEGRAIFWAQALQLRTPLNKLESVAPDVAHRLENISRSLEQGALRDVSRTLEDAPEKVMSREKETTHYRQLNAQWLETVEEARKLDGFQDFLRPKSFATLSAAATNGPVVILNASRSECAALVMTSSQPPVHIPLPEFTPDTAKELVKMIQTQPGASYPLARGERDPYRTPLDGDPDHIFREVLARLWKLVVQPILRSLDIKKSKTPPRLWWCPTGPFVSLPIHAAGLYDADESEAVFDYVISSYTPTLSALLTPPSLADSEEPFKMLVAIQPNTKDQHSLPCTIEELHKIDTHVPSEYLVRFGVKDAPAYVEKILSELPTSSIVHFACHGHQNVNNPLESSLFLEDGGLKVSRLMELPMKRAALVFLSACQTAMGSEELPDEAIHLAATLLFAGFRGAIATMWSIKDRDGPTIADSFYGHLFLTHRCTITDTPRNPPDGTRAAHALHQAVAKLRAEQGCSFVRWVPFIHMGL